MSPTWSSWRSGWIGGAILVGVIAAAASAESVPGEEAAVAAPVRELHGGGGWKSQAQGTAGPQQWNLDAVRLEDGKVRGRIAVANSPVLGDGNVEGTISGDTVQGRIVDDAGILLVQFTGVLDGDTFRGK
jgi:hypothetical protein